MLKLISTNKGYHPGLSGIWFSAIANLMLSLILVNPSSLHGQEGIAGESAQEYAVEGETLAKKKLPCKKSDDLGSNDLSSAVPGSEDCKEDDSLSNYDQTSVDTATAKSVEAELISSDTKKKAIYPVDEVHYIFTGLYSLKDKIHDRIGLAFSVDYSTLMQYASFTESGNDTAASSVFRILGTWLAYGDPEGTSGLLVWKTETRNSLFARPVPRDMGFDTGSALSTANYKQLDWGITDLYWKQKFQGGKQGFAVGHMDPGDWADQYPLLNAWTSFINDAFYNNPTESIPKRGLGKAGQVFFTDTMYVSGGVHDANGKDSKFNFSDMLENSEFFIWGEIGYRHNTSVSAKQNAHIHLWHQNAVEEKDIGESSGITYTHSMITKKGGVAFIRAGYSEGDAPQMRRFIGGGMSYKPFGRDTLGIATSWGSPPDKSLRDQITSEIFYRIQMTQNLTFTLDFQLTYEPSHTLETSWLYIPGLRMRFVF